MLERGPRTNIEIRELFGWTSDGLSQKVALGRKYLRTAEDGGIVQYRPHGVPSKIRAYKIVATPDEQAVQMMNQTTRALGQINTVIKDNDMLLRRHNDAIPADLRAMLVQQGMAMHIAQGHISAVREGLKTYFPVIAAAGEEAATLPPPQDLGLPPETATVRIPESWEQRHRRLALEAADKYRHGDGPLPS